MKIMKALLVFLVLLTIAQPVIAEEDEAVVETSETLNSEEEDDEIYTLLYNVTFLQTEARKQLNMINSFRMGTDNWYWNQDNTEKVYMENPYELEYDYELEKIAMQRCAEIALRFAHERPSGELYKTVHGEFGYSWTSIGENIAWGAKNSSDVFDLWREDEQAYSGQGHRRNMLGTAFNRVGVAGCKINGVFFWVQEFSYSTVPNSKTTANDAKTQMMVDVEGSKLELRADFGSVSSLSVKVGESIGLPPYMLYARYTDNKVNSFNYLNLMNSMGVYIEDDEIADIEGGGASARIVGLAPGTTKFVLEGLGNEIFLKLTVTQGAAPKWPIEYVGLDDVKNDNPSFYEEGVGLVLKDPSKVGYTFDGFYLDDSYTIGVQSIDPLSRGALTLYAKWTPIVYNISYDLNGGTLAGVNPVSYTVEDELTLLEPSKDDMVFAGWYDQNGKPFTGVDKASPRDLQLTAYYRYDSYYSIIYNLNGGVNSINNPDSLSEGGISFKLSAPTRTGYTFAGWYVDPDFAGKATTTITSPSSEGGFIVLNAKWKENTYKLSYNKNKGSLVKGEKLPAIKYTSTQENVVTAIEPYRLGYTFIGWSRDKELTEDSVIYQAGDEITGINGALKDKGTVTLYACWDINHYQLTVNYNGGTIKKGEFVEDGPITILSKIKMPTLEKQYYKFKGFYNDLGKKVSTVSKNYRNLELSALFVPINYKLAYKPMGGKITSPRGTYSTSATIETESIVLPEVQNGELSFGGWYLNYDKLTKEYSGLVEDVNDLVFEKSTVYLYAKWN